jgi:hypothetical protein
MSAGFRSRDANGVGPPWSAMAAAGWFCLPAITLWTAIDAHWAKALFELMQTAEWRFAELKLNHRSDRADVVQAPGIDYPVSTYQNLKLLT